MTVSTKTISEKVSLENGLTIDLKESALVCFNIGYSSIIQAKDFNH